MLKIFAATLIACLAVASYTTVPKLMGQERLTPLAPPQADTSVLTVPSISETKLKYSKVPLNENFDFELEAVDRGKFKLNILQDPESPIVIKVYDIIGNLLHEETVRVEGSFVKEYDLSFLKNQLFIVEVGNENFNKTKSVVAS